MHHEEEAARLLDEDAVEAEEDAKEEMIDLNRLRLIWMQRWKITRKIWLLKSVNECGIAYKSVSSDVFRCYAYQDFRIALRESRLA